MLEVRLSSMTEAVESKAYRVCQQPHFPFGSESHNKEKETGGLREGGDGDGVLMILGLRPPAAALLKEPFSLSLVSALCI